LCRGDMATLIDTRLYLPEAWCDDDERCKKAAIPEDKRQFQSKTQLALAMLKIAQQRGIQFGYVGIDGGYGKEPAFLRSVDEQGCRFVADVHCDQTIYRHDPDPQVPAWSGRGKQPIHRKPQCTGQRVDQWAAAQTADAWQRLTLREGEKGLLVADYLHTQVWVWDGEEDKARCWHLLVRREVGADSISHYCLSNAPLDTSWQELARVQAQRFFIEHSFREAKSECGMADYQVRRWDAWHHHMALVMLGTLFLVKPKKAGRQQWPMLSFNDLVTALEHLLPRRQLTAEELADIINKRHYLRRKAKESHARRSQVARE
jgi:SRSO17 transposase